MEKIKRALRAITAGAAIALSSAGFVEACGNPGEADRAEKTKFYERQNAQSEQYAQIRADEIGRRQTLQRHLEAVSKAHGVSDLRIGDVQMNVRCPGERAGIYVGDKHIGDIYADVLVFDGEEFPQKLTEALKEAEYIK